MITDSILGSDYRKYDIYYVPMDSADFYGVAYFINDTFSEKTLVVDYCNYSDSHEYYDYFVSEEDYNIVKAITNTVKIKNADVEDAE